MNNEGLIPPGKDGVQENDVLSQNGHSRPWYCRGPAGIDPADTARDFIAPVAPSPFTLTEA